MSQEGVSPQGTFYHNDRQTQRWMEGMWGCPGTTLATVINKTNMLKPGICFLGTDFTREVCNKVEWDHMEERE